MTQQMYEILSTNYEELFTKYCKYNKNNIKNSCSCEDNFNDKILCFIESNLEQPTLETLILFLKTKKKVIKSIKTCELKYGDIDLSEEYTEISDENLKLLFINYRTEKKKKVNGKIK